MYIRTNLPANQGVFTLKGTDARFAKSLERLSTGLRINNAGDDPEGLVAANTLQRESASMLQAVANSERGNLLIATADSAMSQVSKLVDDIRRLVTEAANDVAMSPEQLQANQQQIDASLQAIDRISQTTTFAGQKLLNGDFGFDVGTEYAKNLEYVNDCYIKVADFGQEGGRDVQVEVLEEAEQAQTLVTGFTPEQQANMRLDLAKGLQIPLYEPDLGALPPVPEKVSLQFTAQNETDDYNFYIRSSDAIATTEVVYNEDAQNDDRWFEITLAAGEDLQTTLNVLNSHPEVVGRFSAAVQAQDMITLQDLDPATLTVPVDPITGETDFYGSALVPQPLLDTSLEIKAYDKDANLNQVQVQTFFKPNASPNVSTEFDETTRTLKIYLPEPPAGETHHFVELIEIESAIANHTDWGSLSLNDPVTGDPIELFDSVTQVLPSDPIPVPDPQPTPGPALPATGPRTSLLIRSNTYSPDEQRYASTQNTAGGTLAGDLDLQIRGSVGPELLTFTKNTSVQEIRMAINESTEDTGVYAEDVDGILYLYSEGYGSDAEIELNVVKEGNSGVFDMGILNHYTTGKDIVAMVNGDLSVGRGNTVFMSNNKLTMELTIDQAFYSEKIAAGEKPEIFFPVMGGGMLFQIGANVNSQEQARVGVAAVDSATLGNKEVGFLYQLATGFSASLYEDPAQAFKIAIEARDQVSAIRGTLGSIQRDTFMPNMMTLMDAAENIKVAESYVRDTNYAVETSRMMQEQALQQAGLSALSIANQQPQTALQLLQG